MKNNSVSFIIVTWNSEKVIERCLKSLLQQKDCDYEIIVNDNNSKDQTCKIVERFSDVKLFKSSKNLGFAGGCNIGAKKAQGKYLFFINPDTTIQPLACSKILEYLKNNPKIKVIAPKILFMNDNNVINSAGNVVHYLGLSWAGKSGEVDHFHKIKRVTAFSGAAVLIEKELFQQADGFDENFVAYCEDADLSWRLNLLGEKIIFLPQAIVYHDYHYSKGDYKYFYTFRNLSWMIYKNYTLLTLILLLPLLIMNEIAIMLYLTIILRKPKIALQIIISRFKNLANIQRERNKVQRMRYLCDCQIWPLLQATIDFSEYRNIFIKIANIFLFLYYQLIKIIIY